MLSVFAKAFSSIHPHTRSGVYLLRVFGARDMQH